MNNEVDQQSRHLPEDPVYESRQFVHDCSDCQFLGRHGAADLYFCSQGGHMATVIARYGHGGHQYVSGIALIDQEPWLKEAFNRAKARGYL